MTLEAEVQSLRQVPMFRDVDPARLKLLAFTSERVQFSDGQRFFSQGDPSDAAYVILDGRASVLLNTPGGEIQVAELGQQCPRGRDGHSVRYAAIRHDHGGRNRLRLCKSTSASFWSFLAQFPQMSLAIMRELAKRLERTNAQLVAQSSS